MIFNLYNPVAVKIGAERYVFDRKALMFTDVVEIERASGLSFAEWEYELGRGSLMATAALLHALRKREGVPSDYETMNFAAFDLEVVPLHPDGSEFTPGEVAEDIERRVKDKREQANPTAAAEDSAAGRQDPEPETTASTSPLSPRSSTSGHGNGRSSPPKSSSPSKAK